MTVPVVPPHVVQFAPMADILAFLGTFDAALSKLEKLT
jgi:hypothetical protein